MINSFNYQGPFGERFTLPSSCVPDMSVSLRDMLNRHNSGGTLKQFQVSNVPPDSIIPVDFERMSSIDRAQLSLDVADFVATTRGRMQTSRRAREQAAYEERIKEAAAARLGSSLSDE